MSYARFAEIAGIKPMAAWRAAQGCGTGSKVQDKIVAASKGKVGYKDLTPVRYAKPAKGAKFTPARSCRVALRLTMLEVAGQIEVSESMLSRLERGERDWPLEAALSWHRFMHDTAKSRGKQPSTVPDLAKLLPTASMKKSA